jgi:hypothetical protein
LGSAKIPSMNTDDFFDNIPTRESVLILNDWKVKEKKLETQLIKTMGMEYKEQDMRKREKLAVKKVELRRELTEHRKLVMVQT